MEEWKNIKGYEGLYLISSYGRIISLHKKSAKLHFIRKKKNGYLQTMLSKDGKSKHFQLHRLVAEAFIPNPENKSDVHHIDHNQTNNHVDNLMWVTPKEHADLHPESYIHLFRARKKGKCKPVLQIDIETKKVIKVWDSAIEAQRQKGYNASSITQCCKGKLNKTSNFYWKYCKS